MVSWRRLSGASRVAAGLRFAPCPRSASGRHLTLLAPRSIRHPARRNFPYVFKGGGYAAAGHPPPAFGPAGGPGQTVVI
jgi:hypothetical protein